MKIRKITAALVAAATINFPAFSTGIVRADIFAAPEQGNKVIATLPEWIPDDFESALDFVNNYGGAHVDNGLICVTSMYNVQKGRSEDTYGYQLLSTEGMGRKIKEARYQTEDSAACFDVFVYQPNTEGDLELKVVDPHVSVPPMAPGEEFIPPAVQSYSFSVDKDLNITETDIYGWLPDCHKEYDDFVKANGEVSVKDNYLLFCLDSIAGTAYSWKIHEPNTHAYYAWIESGEDKSPFYMEFMMSQSCAIKDAVPLDGGGLYDIMIYKAKADGTVSIGWDLGSFALNNTKITKSLTAECQVVDDGQNILLSGDTRVTLVDSDTNEPLEFGADAGFALIDISTDTDNGGQVIAGIGSNPCILRNIELPDEDKIGLRMPEGYTIPGQESSVSSAPEYMEHSLYPNGSGELIIRVKKEGGNDLPPGTARLTYIDKDTGEPIPTELLRNHPFTFGAEIVTAPDPDKPNARDYWDHVYTIDSNPYIIDEVLAERYSQAAEYQFWGNEKPAVTVYKNGSMDLVVTTKVRVSGNVNNDFDFNIADAVTLQNWLLGRPDAKLKNWAQADFTLDNQIDTFDLCIMLDKLVTIRKNAPEAASFMKTGGVAGIHDEWEVFREDGKCFISHGNIKMRDPDKITYEITEDEYRQIMTYDYQSRIEADKYSRDFHLYDDFYYTTVLTYADGSETNTNASLSSVYSLLEQIFNKYDIVPENKW